MIKPITATISLPNDAIGGPVTIEFDLENLVTMDMKWIRKNNEVYEELLGLHRIPRQTTEDIFKDTGQSNNLQWKDITTDGAQNVCE
ncbi:hypothetical protein TNIN_135481 [Trichonephila inaurata madagascariensis]|uniref:Uncharacterized protein n=1 Tax=Trichonephila inaurata madagascariensis TaxID=2747483 RepID=A0A8X7BUX9_9ARAC|nr:hypothetical protein TNIN_135481 [Trichonephila inaurata madagascariensis]